MAVTKYITALALALCATSAHAACIYREQKTTTIIPSKVITGLYNAERPINGCFVYNQDELAGYASDPRICKTPLQEPLTVMLNPGCCDSIPYGDPECTAEIKEADILASRVRIKLLMAPVQMVSNLYKPYLADPHAEGLNTPESLGAIGQYATYSLQQAIAKNDACETREQGICNIDANIIINGQDYYLSTDVRYEEFTPAKNRRIIRAHFNSLRPNIVSYFFIFDLGVWRIDDVEAVDYKEDGTINDRWSLKETLTQ